MTITSVEKMWSRRTKETASADGRSFTVTFREGIQVVHTFDTDESEIELDPGVPRIRQVYPGTRAVFCTNVALARISPIFTIVSVTWVGELSTEDETSDPVDKEPELNYYSVTSREARDTDAYGRPFTNVNGETVEGFQGNVDDMQLDIVRNYDAISGQLGLQYLNSVNSDAINVLGDVWQPGSAALTRFNIKPITVRGIPQYFTVSASIVFRQAYNTVPRRAWWYRYRNEGMYERTGGTLAFSGGGGTGAAGYVIVTGGAVTAVVITNPGRDYTTPPTVTLTDATGTGAAFSTAVINQNGEGEVNSVAVASGGSGYKTSLVRAVDSNKEPTVKPVLLTVTGRRELDSDKAVFIERPEKLFTLPYAALGLI
jgi:hypothetical protein